ncbi:hypothetical protein Tco_1237064, partial [Tanacetum coccineum]
MEVLLGLIQAATAVEANDSPGVSNATATSAYGCGNAAQRRYGSASGQYVGGYRLLEVCSSNADGGKNNMLSSLFHVLALILNEDKDAREVVSKNGLVKVAADLLSDWNSQMGDSSFSCHRPTFSVAYLFGLVTLQLLIFSIFFKIRRLYNKQWKVKLNIVSLWLPIDNLMEGSHRLGKDRMLSCLKIVRRTSPKKKEKEKPQAETDGIIKHSEAISKKMQKFSGCLLTSFTKDMETDVDSSKGKGKTIASGSEKQKEDTRQESSESLAKVVFILKLLKEILLMYGPSVYVLVRKDAEFSSIHGGGIFFSTFLKELGQGPQLCKMDTQMGRNVTVAVDEIIWTHNDRRANGTVGLRWVSNLGKDIHYHRNLGTAKLMCSASRKSNLMNKKDPFLLCAGNPVKEILESTDHRNDLKNLKVKRIKAQDQDSQSRMNKACQNKAKDQKQAKHKGKSHPFFNVIGGIAQEKPSPAQVRKQSSESLAKVVFILKLLKEILLMYGPSVHVLVRKDAEFISSYGGGIFHHILGSFLPHSRTSKREKKTDADWRYKLAVQRSPGNDIQAFVDLLDDVLAARSRARSATSSLIFGEASTTFIDVGLVRSLTRTLHLLDLDHVESLKVAPALVKVLELVTKEHVHAVEAN